MRTAWLLATTLLLAGPAVRAQQDRFEPNQTRRTAARIQPGEHKRLRCDEEDWFVLSVPAGRRLEVSLRYAAADGDLELELRDERGRLLGWSRGARDEESLSFAPDREQAVFVHVYAASNLYDLRLGLSPSTFTGPGALDGVSCHGADWYALTVPAGKQLAAELDLVPAEGDLDLHLFDPDGNELGSSAAGGEREALRWPAEPASVGDARRVLLQVVHAQRASSAYTLRLTVGEPVLEDLDHVLERERPQGRGQDLLELKNGDVLRGELLDASFPLITPWAELVLPRERLAGIDLEHARSELEAVVTVDGHRLSGLLRHPTLRLRLAGQPPDAPPLEVPRERALRAVFGRRGGERARVERLQYFVLRGGDHFAGRLEGSAGWALDVGFARIPLDLPRLHALRFDPEGRVTVVRPDQGTLKGSLGLERVQVAVPGLGAPGDRVDIHVERLEAIYLQEGFVPEHLGGGRGASLFEFEQGLEPWQAQGTPLTSWYPWTQDASRGQGCARVCGPNGGNYVDGARATLTSPPIITRGLAAPALGLHVRTRLERGADFLVVRASYDAGATWTELHRVTGDVEWTPLAIPLQPGVDQVLIQLTLESDGSIVSQGAWVDQVEVLDQAAPGGR